MDDIIKLLAGFEETAYKILMLVIIIPKTLLNIIFDPVGMRKYVVEQVDIIENNKKVAENQRAQTFTQYFSPVLLLLTLALVPALLLAFLPKTGITITPSAAPDSSTQYVFTAEAAFSSSARGKGYQFIWEVQKQVDQSQLAVAGEVHTDTNPGRGGIKFDDNKDTAADTYTYDFDKEGNYSVKVSVKDQTGNILFTDTKSVSVTTDSKDSTKFKAIVPNSEIVSDFNRKELNFKSLSDVLQKDTTIFLAFALLLPPLFFAFVYSLVTHRQLDELEMRKIFYAECYYFSPLSLAIWAFYYSHFFLTAGTWQQPVGLSNYVPPILALLWFVSVETNALAGESENDNITQLPALFIVVAYLIAITVVGLVISVSIADAVVQEAVRKIIIGIYVLISFGLIGIYFVNRMKAYKQAAAEKKTVTEDQPTKISPRLRWIWWSSLSIILCCISFTVYSAYSTIPQSPVVSSDSTPVAIATLSNKLQDNVKWITIPFGVTQSKTDARYDEKDGSIHITLQPKQNEVPSAYYIYTAEKYSNVQIETKAKSNNDNPHTVSLICRYDDASGWYEFEVADSGDYNIYQVNKVDDTPSYNYTVLTSGNSLIVKTGREENTFTAACIENSLSLFINNNDTPVATVKDPDSKFTSGKVGVAVYSPQSQDVDVQFANFAISEPRPQPNLANIGATATPTSVPSISVTEQFDAELSHWDVLGDREQVKVDPANNSLHFQLIEKDGQYPAITLFNKVSSYSDVQMEATIKNNDSASYGVDLYCRINEKGGYAFEVLSTGSYTLYAYDSNGWTELAPSENLSQIKTGQDSNTYTSECKGNELTLLVNGETIKSFQETKFNYMDGSIGFGVFSSDNKSPVDVSVDSIAITGAASLPSIPDAGTATATTTPSAEAQPAVAQQFFTEEFDRDPHWNYFVTSGDASKATVSFNNSLMTFDLEDLNIYAYYLYDQFEYDDVSLNIRAENRGKNNNNVSLICRKSDKGWYEFSTEGGGVWYLYRVTLNDNGSPTYDAFGDGGAASLRQGLAVNEYGMTCKGNEITLSINGAELTKIMDDTFSSGQVGFNISSLNVTPIIVDVDWFKISLP